ncbi:MAG: hypothetical protein WC776_04905 [Patescibacteria group bacterium]|jgi:hypothetical protein
MDLDRIAILLGEDRQPTDDESTRNVEALASLSSNEFLRRLFVLSFKQKLLDCLTFVAQRKFEEAFGCLAAYEAIEDVQKQLDEAGESLKKPTIPLQSNSIIY